MQQDKPEQALLPETTVPEQKNKFWYWWLGLIVSAALLALASGPTILLTVPLALQKFAFLGKLVSWLGSILSISPGVALALTISTLAITAVLAVSLIAAGTKWGIDYYQKGPSTENIHTVEITTHDPIAATAATVPQPATIPTQTTESPDASPDIRTPIPVVANQ